MLDIKMILADIETAKQKTASRKYEFDFDKLTELDKKRRDTIVTVEALKQERNEISSKVGVLKKDGKDTSDLQNSVKTIAITISELDEKLLSIQSDMSSMLLNLPNFIDDTVPIGDDENANIEIRKNGTPRSFSFTPKSHWDLGVDLGMIDFERGAKIAKSRFTVLSADISRLDRALSAFMLDTHRDAGYVEVSIPFMVNAKSMLGTGQLPKFAEEAFICERDDLYLIPTAEVPVTNLYSDEILDLNKLPIKHACLSACFRREAGSYGKDMRGLIRNHQFNKVELVKITLPEKSDEEHELLTLNAEKILQLLELPYRVMALSSGDIGFASAKTYDIEVWLPAQGCYREISSCSNFKDFQARRAGIRYRDMAGKVQFAHTLNGSGLAVGRTIVAILENYQNEDGSITVPTVLRKYLNGLEIIK